MIKQSEFVEYFELFHSSLGQTFLIYDNVLRAEISRMLCWDTE